MIVHPNAKINIGLNVIERRADGFHNIETLMVPFALTDNLKLNVNKSIYAKKFELVIDGLAIDGALDSNLVSRAYYLLNADFTLPPVKATLEKKIPMGAGLGGGSADCAFAISALNKMFDLKLSVQQMQKYASMLGSDCAIFVENKPAIATSRGEVLQVVNIDLSDYKLLIVKPQVHVNTAQAYKMLTPQTPQYSIKNMLNCKPEEWRNKITNDFEEPIFTLHPTLRKIKEQMYATGAAYASMSGSGSAIYGLFKQLPDTEQFNNDGNFVWTGKIS